MILLTARLYCCTFKFGFFLGYILCPEDYIACKITFLHGGTVYEEMASLELAALWV